MDPTPRQQREVAAHNQLAEALYADKADEVFTPDALTLAMLQKMGPLTSLRVLECGCGRGLFTAFLAQQGAHVTAFDISDGMVALAHKRLGNAANVSLHVGAIEALALPKASFDIIVGLDILHHIDLDQALPRLATWLTPHGQAYFVENLGLNPILTLARQLLAGRMGVAKYGTDDERPLSRGDLAKMRRHFDQVDLLVPEMVFLQIFSRNVLRYRYLPWLQRLLAWGDQALFKVPALHWLSYKAVVVLSCPKVA